MTQGIVGVVGLGNIGCPIASRLAERFKVHGYDADTGRKAPEGVVLAQSVRELAGKAEIVCLSLPSTEAALRTIEEIAALAPASRTTRLIVELSTIGVETAVREHDLLSAAGLQHVDAPVSGGVDRARNGTLAVMCSGPPQAVAAAEPVLQQLATKIFVMGDRPGLGQAMKLANNVISAAALAITSEALIFGGRLGLSPEKMIEVINVSTGRTEVSEVKFTQTILPRNYRGAYARVMGKDVGLYLKGATEARLDSPLARRTGEIWDAFVRDAPMKDFQMIYEYLREKAEEQP